MNRRLVLLFAITCGAAVANLYYAQPLLDAIARSLGTSESTAGFVVTASQIGYAAGLVLMVPLGDLLDRRKLVPRLLLVCAAALVGCAVAPSLAVLALAVGTVGITSVVAQVLVPLAGDLAGDDERGKVVGTVMSGLLIGILASRVVAGIVADLAGWRVVYVIGAALMVAAAIVLWRWLPYTEPKTDKSYGSLLRSVLDLVREEPVLRQRMAYGALGMASFTVLWTALTFLLVKPPFDYSEGAIGLVGLAGLAGALAAQGAGRLVDRGHGRAATGVFWLLVAVAWLLCDLGATSIVVLLIGIVILDVGVQGQHITNQTTIYALRPEARSRVTTAYMTGNFLVAAIGSAGAAIAWEAGGWDAVCALGGATALAALAVWALEPRSLRRSASGRAAQEA